jgi:hypothetical protein
MNELSFLIDLLINHKLPRAVKELIVERIKILDVPITKNPAPTRASIQHSRADLAPPGMPTVPQVATIPVEQIAQTPEAAVAIASRNQALREAMSGKMPKGQERPRKW